jgi:tRNA 2-thiouridine synthesizing protein A
VIEIDCLGRRCPIPVIELAKAMRTAPAGEIFQVLADDPAAANDIPAWCRLKNQEFIGETAEYTFQVRKIS